MDIRNLIIEVTRKCNIACAHCMRGEAENIDLKKEYIDVLLEQVDYISTVTFTGGEPSLHTEIIEYFLDQCKQRKIAVGSFYIATNGVKVKEDFVISCLKWYAYSEEKEMCAVQVSNDMYHQSEDSYDTDLLDGLSFFTRKYQLEGYHYNHNRGLINEGRAKENFTDSGRPNHFYKIEIKDTDDFNELEVYLNCNGEIINGCDWSYESQDNNIICTVDKLKEFYEKLEVV